MANNLTPEKALIFRIVHVDNLPWLLRHGLPCRTAQRQHPEYRGIGNAELIEKRQQKVISIEPGGTLGDYVPFYFTPFSPMMYNISTGYGGIRRLENQEIAVLVSSLPRLAELAIEYVVADRHAYLATANFFRDQAGLADLPWADWQQRNFRRDPEDPERFERYQAEALVHRELPIQALLGIVVYNDLVKAQVEQQAGDIGVDVEVYARKGWFF